MWTFQIESFNLPVQPERLLKLGIQLIDVQWELLAKIICRRLMAVGHSVELFHWNSRIVVQARTLKMLIGNLNKISRTMFWKHCFQVQPQFFLEASNWNTLLPLYAVEARMLADKREPKKPICLTFMATSKTKIGTLIMTLFVFNADDETKSRMISR